MVIDCCLVVCLLCNSVGYELDMICVCALVGGDYCLFTVLVVVWF